MKVNLFIPGAGRAGTTAIQSWLSQHPEIDFSWAKEPSYFDRNFHLGVDWYHSLFRRCAGRYIGEASTNYLWYPDAPMRIANYNRDARFIISLRNPVLRAYSEYTRRIQRRGETRSFEKVLKETSFLTKRSDYGHSISRYLDHFHRENFHFILFERFKADPETEVRNVFRFLGLDHTVDLTSNQIKANASTMPSSLHFQKLRNFVGSDLTDPAPLWYLKAVARKFIDKTNHAVQIRKIPKITDSEYKTAYEMFAYEWPLVAQLTDLSVEESWIKDVG